MPGPISSIFVKLISPSDFLLQGVSWNAILAFAAQSTAQRFRTRNRQQLSTLLDMADGVITLLMAVAAVFRALNIMYANVANGGRRSRHCARWVSGAVQS